MPFILPKSKDWWVRADFKRQSWFKKKKKLRDGVVVVKPKKGSGFDFAPFHWGLHDPHGFSPGTPAVAPTPKHSKVGWITACEPATAGRDLSKDRRQDRQLVFYSDWHHSHVPLVSPGYKPVPLFKKPVRSATPKGKTYAQRYGLKHTWSDTCSPWCWTMHPCD